MLLIRSLDGVESVGCRITSGHAGYLTVLAPTLADDSELKCKILGILYGLVYTGTIVSIQTELAELTKLMKEVPVSAKA